MVAAMGKAPVVFKQMVQGYVANRLQAAMQLEVYRLLDEGLVTPKDIDDSVLHGLALRIPILGIMAKADFTGLLLMQQGLKNRSYTPPVPRDRSETLDALIAEGRTGVMAGKGYFDWGDRSAGRAVPRTRPEAAGAEAGAAGDRPDGGQMITLRSDGKTALVTGGASGIGFATAKMLAGFGATVAVNFLADDPRGPEAVDQLIDRPGARRSWRRAASATPAGREAMVEKAVADLGRLDLLVNNAGTPGTRHRIAPADLDADHRRVVVDAAGGESAGGVPLRQGGGAGVEGSGGRDRQHRLDRRAGPRRQQPGLWRDQGGGGQPDAEPGAGAGAGGAGERDRAGRGGQFLDGGMDQ